MSSVPKHSVLTVVCFHTLIHTPNAVQRGCSIVVVRNIRIKPNQIELVKLTGASTTVLYPVCLCAWATRDTPKLMAKKRTKPFACLPRLADDFDLYLNAFLPVPVKLWLNWGCECALVSRLRHAREHRHQFPIDWRRRIDVQKETIDCKIGAQLRDDNSV